MAMKTYIPGEVVLTINGVATTNWEELAVTYDEDWWTFHSGSGGEGTRTKNSNRIGSIEVTLPQSSSLNATCTAAAYSDTLVPVAILDPNGGSNHLIGEATIMKIADSTYAKTDQSNRAWMCKGILDINILNGNV